MSSAYVDTQFPKKGLAEITFFHPKHNSLPGDILQQLQTAIYDCGDNDDVQVIILKSGGERTFCAGASFDELIAIDNEESGKKFFSGFAGVINACRKCPKIIIGRVQGKAVGGGVGLAAAVDYCMATRFASVKLSELNIGIGPFVIGPAVSRKVGMSAFSQMALNADQFYTPDWAQQKGLYCEVFENTQALDEGVEKLADYLLSTNPVAQKELKEIFWKGTDHWDELLAERAAMSGKLVLSEYTKQTLKRFAEQ